MLYEKKIDFFFYIIVFKIKRNSLLFPLLFSPAYYFEACKCSLCQARVSTHNYKQVPSTKKFGTARRKNSTKNCDAPLMHSFSIPETPNGPLMNVFLETKSFGHLFLVPPPWFTKIFALDKYAAPDKIRISRDFQK